MKQHEVEEEAVADEVAVVAADLGFDKCPAAPPPPPLAVDVAAPSPPPPFAFTPFFGALPSLPISHHPRENYRRRYR